MHSTIYLLGIPLIAMPETIEFQHCHQCVVITVGSVVNDTLMAVVNFIASGSSPTCCPRQYCKRFPSNFPSVVH